jgi:hypothetical protein
MTTPISTLFLLMAEFGAVDIPVERAAARYLGLDLRSAKSRAARGELPFPAYRCGSQKSPWIVRVTDLADWIDRERAKGLADWQERQGIRT